MSTAADEAASESAQARTRDAPGLADAFDQIKETGRATWSAGNDAFKAFRILLTADISLARSAFGRVLALTGVAIAFGASCWLLLMATLVVFLSRNVGMSWAGSLLCCALLSGLVTAVAIWRAIAYFEDTRLQATRRQLARMGIGELADFMPDPAAPKSSRAAAAEMASASSQAEPVKKGLGVDVTPP